MRWSQLKKRIENNLSDSVRARISFGSTVYRKSHDDMGRGWITIDGREILDMSSLKFDMEFYRARPARDEYEKVTKRLQDNNLFAQWDLHRSLFEYLSLSIDEILSSKNPLIRAIGMLDARAGKRRLKSIDVSNEHQLVKRLHDLRCDAEGIPREGERNLTSPIVPLLSNSTERADENEKRKRVVARLTLSKKTRNIRSLISAIHSSKISKDELDTPVSQEIFAGFEETSDPETLLQVLMFVESKSELLEESPYVRGVIGLTQDASHWLRPLQEWVPMSHNPSRQFSSLSRHLWANYHVPVFMDNAWSQRDRVQREWFRHLGAGNNIRTADGLPFPLTKMMAHHFLGAPDTYSIEAAFRRGQVLALGGDERLVNALVDTRIISEYRDNEFWLSVFRFFIQNPMLDPVHINPIVDYIWNQRYEPRVIFIQPGVARDIGPEQPSFSMRGRTVDALLRAIDAWHGQLGRETKGGQFQWQKSDIQDFTFIEGSKESRNMKVCRITELLSSNELVAEGRQMRHCVASYSHSCHSGTRSIWKMDVETEDGVEKLVTIEVDKANKTIRQVRGKRNRYATDQEKGVILRWAEQSGFTETPYA